MLVDHSLKIKKEFKETGDSRSMYPNEFDKSCFQHDMAYEDFKDLNRRTAANKVLRDKVFNIAKNPKYDGYQHGLLSMVYNFFDKKETVSLVDKPASGGTVKNKIISNKELPETNKFLESLRKKKYTHLLLTIFRVQVKQICSQ